MVWSHKIVFGCGEDKVAEVPCVGVGFDGKNAQKNEFGIVTQRRVRKI